MHYQAGDVFACYGTDPASRFIRAWTTLPPLFAPSGLRTGISHVAICAHDQAGRLAWWESTSLGARPCLVQGRAVKGVQVHWPEERIEDYVRAGGKVVVYRLVEIDELTSVEQHNLHKMLRRYVKRRTSYDYAGAAISGLRLCSLIRLLRVADEDEMFCSELISACLQRLCRMNRENPARFTPARLLRQLVRQGTYRREQTFERIEQLEVAGVIPFGRCA